MKGITRIFLLVGFILFMMVPIALIIFGASPVEFANQDTEFLFVVLFFIPVVAGFVGVLVIAAHPKTYHFSPIGDFDEEQTLDPLAHVAVGGLEAITNDLTNGVIANPNMYTPELYAFIDQELRAFALYRQRGYQLTYQFYHSLQYAVNIVEMINKHDVVIEIQGVFDYFVEREGVRRLTPHDYDQRSAIMQQQSVVRVRLQSPTGAQWKVAGYSDSALEFQLGAPTV